MRFEGYSHPPLSCVDQELEDVGLAGRRAREMDRARLVPPAVLLDLLPRTDLGHRHVRSGVSSKCVVSWGQHAPNRQVPLAPALVLRRESQAGRGTWSG